GSDILVHQAEYRSSYRSDRYRPSTFRVVHRSNRPLCLIVRSLAYRWDGDEVVGLIRRRLSMAARSPLVAATGCAPASMLPSSLGEARLQSMRPQIPGRNFFHISAAPFHRHRWIEPRDEQFADCLAYIRRP